MLNIFQCWNTVYCTCSIIEYQVLVYFKSFYWKLYIGKLDHNKGRLSKCCYGAEPDLYHYFSLSIMLSQIKLHSLYSERLHEFWPVFEQIMNWISCVSRFLGSGLEHNTPVLCSSSVGLRLTMLEKILKFYTFFHFFPTFP